MSNQIEVVGLYPAFETEKPVTLVELWIRNYNGELDFARFSQKIPKLGLSQDQVAYLEYLLSDDGASGHWLSSMKPLQIDGSARVTFFMHYLDTNLPLSTPWGPLILPKHTSRPERLSFVEYFPP